tara:strand:+ start:1134 stop:1916 length:783 start_codon:yes stop_codon:yes gene_type:complete
MQKIKILSGWSNPGGSTTSFINLCNMFNENGLDCTFYGPHTFPLGQCNFDLLENCAVNEEGEVLISHFLKLPERPEASKKVILACHEKEVYKVKDVKPFWDDIAYVSNSQMFWQGIPGTVIPNVITHLVKSEDSSKKLAGVIGSIDKNKNTHVSIQRALDDGFDEVYLYGMVTDQEYYKESVEHYVTEGKAIIKGYEPSTQKVYDSLTDVYHSSLSETFNLIKAECDLTGTLYHGLDSAESGAEYWDNDKILKAWKELIK